MISPALVPGPKWLPFLAHLALKATLILLAEIGRGGRRLKMETVNGNPEIRRAGGR